MICDENGDNSDNSDNSDNNDNSDNSDAKIDEYVALDSISYIDLKNRNSNAIEKLRWNVKNTGFFIIHNCNVEIDNIVSEMKQFFSLSSDEKEKFHMKHSTNFRGWTRLNEEITENVPDRKESVDFGLNTEISEYKHIPDSKKYKRLIGKNIYHSPGCKESVEKYMSDMCEIGKELLMCVALAIDEPEDFFVKKYTEPFPLLRMMRYPKGGNIGEHIDYGCLTIIYQHNNVCGLEILTHDDEKSEGKSKEMWKKVIPKKSTLIVNFGHSLEKWSDGRIKATKHRVNVSEERFSLPFFYEPNLDSKINDQDDKEYGDYLYQSFCDSYEKM